MAFSSSFFTVEAGAGSADAENAGNNDKSMETGTNIDNGRSKPSDEGPDLQEQQLPPVASSGGSDSHNLKGASAGDQQQLPLLPPHSSPSRARSSSALPTTAHHHQHNQPRHTGNIPTSDGADQFVSEDQPIVGSNEKIMAKPATKKKKGTATTIKAPKRGRPGTSKKAKTKKATGLSPTAMQNGGDAAAENDGDADDSSESDSGPYCLCRGPDNHRFMIACDRCEDWFHGDCIGMDKFTGENLVQKYICPNCSDGKRYVTRYKKMCSFDGCSQPARIYEVKKPSIFCSQEHCQSWWEQLVASLPRNKGSLSLDTLTQDEFIGLLDTSPRKSGEKTPSWKLGDTPFGVAPDFWETVDLKEALTSEERDFLDRSAAERYSLAEDIVLHKKMMQVLEMGLKQREAAIASGTLTKDVCGYDSRLDTVGVTHQFAAFLRSPEGEAVFKAGRLDDPSLPEPSVPLVIPVPGAEGPVGVRGMCVKKKCKTHQMWGAILAKQVKHSIKELAAQAKEKLDAETRMRSNAAGRFRRKQMENNSVVVFDDSSDGDEDFVM